MAPVTTPAKTCSKCAPRNVLAVSSCNGCLANFCWTHFIKHRQGLFDDLQKISEQRDELLKDINQALTPKKIPRATDLIDEIDRWKIRTIQSVNQAAAEATKLVKQFAVRRQPNHHQWIERLNEIDVKLKEQQKSNNFVEADINLLLEELKRIKTDLGRFSVDVEEKRLQKLQIQPINWPTIIRVISEKEPDQTDVVKVNIFSQNLPKSRTSSALRIPFDDRRQQRTFTQTSLEFDSGVLAKATSSRRLSVVNN